MVIERRVYDGRKQYTVTTECVFCGEELEDGEGPADHLDDCENHPAGEQR